MSPDDRQVPLAAVHRAAGATFTTFAGWRMPVRYGSDLAEHHAVRTAAGLFDLSHMGQIGLVGTDAARTLERALVSRVRDLALGRARYTMLCDESGGVIDDVIVYHLPDQLLVIANAANTTPVLDALRAKASGLDTNVIHHADRVLLALQGPRAAAVLSACGAPEAAALRPFSARTLRLGDLPVLVARTGYTGEDGFELAADATDAADLWERLLEAGRADGVLACGLAARDTLRLEAGLPLHGNELGAELGPVETGFTRIVHLDRDEDFPGRRALAERTAEGPAVRIVGLIAPRGRSPRRGDVVSTPQGVPVGTVTSGAPSPTLGVPVALAAVTTGHTEVGTQLVVTVRGSDIGVEVTALPFVTRTT